MDMLKTFVSYAFVPIYTEHNNRANVFEIFSVFSEIRNIE